MHMPFHAGTNYSGVYVKLYTNQVLQSTVSVCPDWKTCPLCRHGQLVSLIQPPAPSDTRPYGHMQPDVQPVLICIQPEQRVKKLTEPNRACEFTSKHLSSLSLWVCAKLCLHKPCPECCSSSDTQSQWSQVEQWSSQSIPWGQCMMVRLNNTQGIQIQKSSVGIIKYSVIQMCHA